jgi:hypothetical protein
MQQVQSGSKSKMASQVDGLSWSAESKAPQSAEAGRGECEELKQSYASTRLKSIKKCRLF